MNSFDSLIYLAAAGVYLVLRRQSAAHRRAIALEYIRLGVTPPRSRPKIEMLEAMLTTTIGLIMAGAAAAMLVMFLGDDVVRTVVDPALLFWLAVLLAGGLTLIILGGRAMWDNMHHADRISGRVAAPPASAPPGQ